MKSQELKQIHALLYEVRKYLCNGNTVPSDPFESYDSQPVRPTHVHQSKQAHKNGIELLVAGIERVLQLDPPPKTPVVLPASQQS
ncbi:UPF0058 family protein [Halohasta salina]|uniref:UPF0058 family protein n=1 Tax=Halohasta salina TaxID=2961621 RepID=UPI003CCDF76C